MGKRIAPAALAALALLATDVVPAARAGWAVGVSIGAPVYHRPAPYCYRPYYPVYVRPAPVYVQPVTVIERVPAYVVPAPSVSRAPESDYTPPPVPPAETP